MKNTFRRTSSIIFQGVDFSTSSATAWSIRKWVEPGGFQKLVDAGTRVLLGVWATPRMTIGHAILALGFTGYVLIGMRYEERDLARTFGTSYRRWREATE